MRFVSKYMFGITALCGTLASANAATLTDISFRSNGLSYNNNTVVDGTSPLAFTATTDLNQSFLNAPDSTISLGYGSYYAIAFLGFGEHVGEGNISFVADGTPYSKNVTFPNPASASSVFASFALAGGDTVTIATTGLSADRIRIVGDGGGLQGDSTPDAFYSFKYANASAVPEPASGAMLTGGLAMMGLLLNRRRR